jgi:hypothetical protein
VWKTLKTNSFSKYFSGTHELQKCFHDESTKYKVCTEEKIENSLRFLDSIQGNMISILCSNSDDSSDTCDKLVYPKRPKNIRRTKSIVMPIVDILNSIKDWIYYLLK